MAITSRALIESSRLDGWQNYPMGIRRCEVDMDDVRRYREELNEKAPDLFVDEQNKSTLELLETYKMRTENPRRPILKSTLKLISTKRSISHRGFRILANLRRSYM